MSRLRFLPSREEAKSLRLAVGDQVWFNNRVYQIEVLGMRYAHLRAEDGTLTQFAKLAACHRITGDESPMDSFQSTTVFNRDSLLKK